MENTHKPSLFYFILQRKKQNGECADANADPLRPTHFFLKDEKREYGNHSNFADAEHGVNKVGGKLGACKQNDTKIEHRIADACDCGRPPGARQWLNVLTAGVFEVNQEVNQGGEQHGKKHQHSAPGAIKINLLVLLHDGASCVSDHGEGDIKYPTRCNGFFTGFFDIGTKEDACTDKQQSEDAKGSDGGIPEKESPD